MKNTFSLPINQVIISGLSAPAVLTDAGFLNWANSVGLCVLPVYLHVIPANYNFLSALQSVLVCVVLKNTARTAAVADRCRQVSILARPKLPTSATEMEPKTKSKSYARTLVTRLMGRALRVSSVGTISDTGDRTDRWQTRELSSLRTCCRPFIYYFSSFLAGYRMKK